jgi:hypothetical protein
MRTATEGIIKQLVYQTREQARPLRSGAAGELTEAEVERIAADIAAAARAQLDAAVPHDQNPSADPGHRPEVVSSRSTSRTRAGAAAA